LTNVDKEEERKAENVAWFPLQETRAPMAMAIVQRDEMELFLCRVSVLRGLSLTNVDSWIRAIKAKFVTIGIMDVMAVMTNIMKINRMLVLHATTHQCIGILLMPWHKSVFTKM
jgi:hypothetical protein